jgi:hypothetical protein
MTDEQINIAIAEHCGFTDIMWPTGFHQKMSDEKSKQAGGRWRFQIPDCCNDLNAMHEAEKTMVNEPSYWVKLTEVVLGFEYLDFDPSNEYSCLEVASASARQRAEAFLKTIGKWEA